MADPSAPFQYAPLVNTDYWSIGFTGLTTNGENIFSGDKNVAIVDSGTTVALIDNGSYHNFLAQLKKVTSGLQTAQQGIAYYDGPCPTTAPTVTVKVAGTDGDIAIDISAD
eukprot:m.312982 g.312982  ORF g.312982 m.312982 type:complete len:111 (+) comp332382_c0_seq1:284-616(+)